MNNDYPSAIEGSTKVTVRDYTGKMQLLTMTDIADIVLLRNKGLIGAHLKKNVINGSVILFTGKLGTGAVCIRLVGDRVKARLLSECSQVHTHALTVMLTNAARTVYSTYPVDVELDPIYSDSELGRVPHV